MPHVHIKGAGFAAKVRISNGDLLAGDAPNRALKQARLWVEEHQAELLAMWDEFKVTGMSDEIARVTKVRAAGDRVLRVRFAGERRDRELDMTGLIARSVHFAPLMEDTKTFARAEIVEEGLGISCRFRSGVRWMFRPRRCGGSRKSSSR